MKPTPKQLANLTPIKKGQVLNPLGGAAHSPAVKLIRRLTAAEVAELGTLLLTRNIEKLRDIDFDADNNPDSKHSALKAMIAKSCIVAYRKGDFGTVDAILNRLIGKVKEKVELTTPGLPGAEELTEEDRTKRLNKYRRMLAETDEE